MLINDHEIIIEKKDVKHINLKVYPDLTIKASVPKGMQLTTVKRMIISKDNWIKSQLLKYEDQERMSKRLYISGEDHYINGKRYILNVVDSNTPKVEIKDKKNVYMYVRKSSSLENKEKIMNQFYKVLLKDKLDIFVQEIEKKIGVNSNSYSIRKMKNKWGSCNQDSKQLLFNVELGKKSDSEIKYVVTHELIHLIEKKHNDNFKRMMYEHCPKWESYHDSLNKLLNSNKID